MQEQVLEVSHWRVRNEDDRKPEMLWVLLFALFLNLAVAVIFNTVYKGTGGKSILVIV